MPTTDTLSQIGAMSFETITFAGMQWIISNLSVESRPGEATIVQVEIMCYPSLDVEPKKSIQRGLNELLESKEGYAELRKAAPDLFPERKIDFTD